MKKNINKKFKEQKFDKKLLLKKAINALDFNLIKEDKDLIKDIYLLLEDNFSSKDAETLLNNFIRDDKLLEKIKMTCISFGSTSFKRVMEALTKGLKEETSDATEKENYFPVLKNLSNHVYRFSFKDLTEYIFTATSRLKFEDGKTARVNNLSYKKTYNAVFPNRGHYIYSCEATFINFVIISKFDSIKYVFSVNNRLFFDSNSELNLISEPLIREESLIPYSDIYNVYFLNTISSDINELKPFVKKIRDDYDFEDYYNFEYQCLKSDKQKNSMYSFEDDLIEDCLRKANQKFIDMKDRPYSGRFKVLLPTKKLFAFAVNYHPKKPS